MGKSGIVQLRLLLDPRLVTSTFAEVPSLLLSPPNVKRLSKDNHIGMYIDKRRIYQNIERLKNTLLKIFIYLHFGVVLLLARLFPARLL